MAIDMQALIKAMTVYMTTCMAGHDPSHNPQHVLRVVRLAHTILEGELSRHSTQYDRDIITLAATLHDIGDRKYLPKPTAETPIIDPKQMVFNTLVAHGADASLAERVQTIVSNVSYSNEIKDPAAVRALIADERYRELAVVQDADRLDAIGAVGIARTFTYLGSRQKNAPEQRWELDESIGHFGQKLEKLEGIMKTDTGREMARERTRRLREFKAWWMEETGNDN
jgi:uncharacterized protein